ncbi:MAG: hypothetical protein GQ540_04065 [Lutibacter sp.]|uniref:hypothetical protein n=1 Tax=Lutibacter sp. TaxID=1925666 RepID=UPI0019EC40D6|nr:hypothetical protein [Lutibacter sp.]NOR27690.1 hypothetical protein [Lutibacter sp.]
MKKLIYLIMVFGLVFTACEPMDEINAAIDAQETPIAGDADYTLTDDDYDTLGLNYGSFSSEDDAKSDIPALLTDMYPVWGKGSSVLVGYQLYIGNAFGIEDYYLNQDDYTFGGSDLLGFQSDAVPTNYLADILADNINYADEGDYAVAKYFQFTGSAYTVTPEVLLEENFDYGNVADDITVASGGNWVAHSSSGYNPAGYTTADLSMTDYPTSGVGGAIRINNPGNEDVNTSFSPVSSGTVYYSALVNLGTVDDGTYFIHFMEEDGSYNYAARVGAKDDGSGNILFGIGASSSTLTYGSTSFDLDTTYLIVASYDIATGKANLYVLSSALSYEPSEPLVTNTGTAGYTLERIGVRQGGGGPNANIDGIRVANTWSAIMSNDELDDVVIGDKTSKVMGYTYTDGAWVTAPERFYLVSAEDFDSMGEDSGQPGRYNNFGSSTPPNDYLPTFLKLKFPYALEGTELDVAYDYYSSNSGAQVRGNLYTLIDGEWIAYSSTISTVLQFGHDGNNWVPDNTIKYTLTAADYTYMADQLTGNPDYDNVSLPNLSNYSDFDYNWTEGQVVEALGILADHLSPAAEEGQKYFFTYLLYDNGINELSMSLIKTGGVWVLNN